MENFKSHILVVDDDEGIGSLLKQFLNENGIEIEKSNMSFSVSVKETEIEYCGKGLLGIFSNKKNFFNYFKNYLWKFFI